MKSRWGPERKERWRRIGTQLGCRLSSAYVFIHLSSVKDVCRAALGYYGGSLIGSQVGLARQKEAQNQDSSPRISAGTIVIKSGWDSSSLSISRRSLRRLVPRRPG